MTRQWLHWRLSRILTRPSYVSITHNKTVITLEAVKDTDSPLLRVNHTWQDSDYTGGCQGYWLAPLTCQSHMTRQWLHWRLSRILTRPSYVSITHDKTVITLEAVKDTDSPLLRVNHTWQDSDYTGGCQGYWLAPLTCQSHMTRQWLHWRLSRILTRPSYVSITHDNTVITLEAVKDTDSPLLRVNHTWQDSDYTGGCQGYWLAPLTCQSHMTTQWLHRRRQGCWLNAPLTWLSHITRQWLHRRRQGRWLNAPLTWLSHITRQWLHWRLSRILTRPSYVSITHDKTVITLEAVKDTDSPLLRVNHTWQDSDYTGGCQGYWLAPLTCQSHMTRQWLHWRLSRILTRPSYVSITHDKTVITLEAVKDTDSPLLRVNHTWQDSDYTGGCQGYWLAPLTCQSHMTRQWLHWRLSRILTRPSYVSITHDKTVITLEAVKDTDSPLLRVNHTWQDSDYTGGCQGYWLAPLTCQSHMTRQWLHWRLSRILTRPSYVSITHDKTVITLEAVKDTDSPLLRVNHTWQDSDYTGGCQGYWLAPLT